MERLNPGQPVYNEVEAVRLRGELNVEALERALNAVIARHETLRTTIEAVDGVAMARVRESYLLRLKMIDLSGRDSAEREAELERLADLRTTDSLSSGGRACDSSHFDSSGRAGARLHSDDASFDLRLVIGGRVVAGIVGAVPRISP